MTWRCSPCRLLLNSRDDLSAHNITTHMRQTPPQVVQEDEFRPGTLVLTPTGLVVPVVEVDEVGRVTVRLADGMHMTRPKEDYIPAMKLTKGQCDLLEAHTARFSGSFVQRSMKFDGRRCKCHGLFYLGKRVEHLPAYPDRFHKTGELYALYNLSAVENILYLEGHHADDDEAD